MNRLGTRVALCIAGLLVLSACGFGKPVPVAGVTKAAPSVTSSPAVSGSPESVRIGPYTQVSSLRTSRTVRASVNRVPGGGVSRDIQDSRPAACGDVESPACHYCRHCQEAAGQRGRPQLRGRPVLGLRAAGPLPGRGRSSIRAALTAAEDRPERGQRPGRRPDRAVA